MPHRGALGNLTIETTAADGGVWMFELWVEGEPSFVGCRLGILQTTCQSVSTRSVSEGDRVTLAIGNPGRPFDASAGRGRFRVRYGFELTR